MYRYIQLKCVFFSSFYNVIVELYCQDEVFILLMYYVIYVDII